MMKPSVFVGKPCYWCRRTLLPSMGRNQHPLSATIDHVRSRPECMNHQEYTDPRNKVGACFECNQRRGEEWAKKLERGEIFKTKYGEDLLKNRRAAEERRKLRELHIAAEKEMRRPPLKITVPPELEAAWETYR